MRQSPHAIDRREHTNFGPFARFCKLGCALSLLVAGGAYAQVFSYVDPNGDYVVSKTKPTDPNTEYAILSDDGEFVRLVKGRTARIPMSHWRPWFIPKESHPFDGVPQDINSERVPDVKIEEVETP